MERPPLKKPRRKSQQEEAAPIIPVLPQPPAYLPQLLPVETPVPDDGKIFIGDIEVKTDNGKLICPVKECSKHFRRENLLHVSNVILFFDTCIFKRSFNLRLKKKIDAHEALSSGIFQILGLHTKRDRFGVC